ncbi:MAG TPA: hypothetical protein VFD73_20650, partial [Gemmatimonadales bacterium]|nr:hypothetical protein [Gemmatimonadales bacterium]
MPSSLDRSSHSLPSQRELEALAGQVDHLAPGDLQSLYAGLTRAAQLRSEGDGLFWLRFVLTRDEADAEHSVKPFPLHLEYLVELWRVLDSRQCVVIAKSRQMLVSWAIATYTVWWARHKPNQAIYWQSQQARDAVNMVCAPKGAPMGRCQFIEANLPSWMRIPITPLEGRLVYPNGSFIQALPGGAGQIRGNVPSLYVGDEFAFQEEQKGVWTAVAPLIQKGAKAFLISTPNGSMNQFAE